MVRGGVPLAGYPVLPQILRNLVFATVEVEGETGGRAPRLRGLLRGSHQEEETSLA